MSDAIDNLRAAFQRGMTGRPKVGGFPYLAEVLRRAGVTRNLWSLPSCHSFYFTEKGPVAIAGTSLITGMGDVPPFDRDALVAALRIDQAGNSTFPEFLAATWKAGVVSYDVDFSERVVTYYGLGIEKYVESYPAAEV